MKKLFLFFAVLGVFSPHQINAQGSSDWNLSFEDWEEVRQTDEGIEENGYEVEGGMLGKVSGWGMFRREAMRTTDASHGNFAIVLNDWYYVPWDYMVMGENGFPSYSECSDCGIPIDKNPTTIKGDYKIDILENRADSILARIDVYLTKYLVNEQRRDTVGKGAIELDSHRDEYTEFELPIIYKDSNISADSIIVFFSLLGYGDFDNDEGCSNCLYWYLDNFRFDYTVSTSSISNKQEGYGISPNPCSDSFRITNYLNQPQDLYFFDISGRLENKLQLGPDDTMHFTDKLLGSNIWFVKSKQTGQVIKLVQH